MNPESHYRRLLSTTDVIICRENKENLWNHTVLFLCIPGTSKECKWLFEKWKNKFAICLNLFTSHLVEGVEETFSYLPLVCCDPLCPIFFLLWNKHEVILTKHLCFSSTLYNAIPGTHASYYDFQTPIYCSLDLFLGGQRVGIFFSTNWKCQSNCSLKIYKES